MSTTPALPPTSTSTDDKFIVELLLQQQDLSAVEAFSEFHDQTHSEPAQSQYYKKLIPVSTPDAGQQYAFEVDLDACSGCKACVVACHTLNGLEEEETWRSVGLLVPPEESNDLGPYHVTTACHHCLDPGCLKGCPVKAYDKDPETGIVRHLDDQCIGCQYCTMMCPYEIPQYSSAKGIVRKCDMCQQRLAVGEAPACVQACPNEAIRIQIVDCDDIASSVEGALLVPDSPQSSITVPTTSFKSSQPIADLTRSQDAGVDEPAHSHWPLAIMLVLSQLSVGIVVGERLIGLLYGVTSELSRLLVTIAAVIGVVGIHVALLHLGRPVVAFRAFLGLRTSWMSREIVVFGGYMGAIVSAAGLMWLPEFETMLPELAVQYDLVGKSRMLVTPALFSAMGLGILGVYCSGMIYVATRRQLWRPSRTMLRFFGSSILLGFALAGFLALGSEVSRNVGAVYLLFAGAALGWKLNWERFLLSNEGAAADTYDRRSRKLAHSKLKPLVSARILASLGGGFLLAVAAVFQFLDLPTAALVSAIVAVGLMVLGEIAERFLYFMAVVYDRMPGALR